MARDPGWWRFTVCTTAVLSIHRIHHRRPIDSPSAPPPPVRRLHHRRRPRFNIITTVVEEDQQARTPTFHGRDGGCPRLLPCHHASLLDARLYLPQKWTDDPERCEKAGVPEDQRTFKPKTELAIDLIKEADEFGVDYSWIGVDAGYGKDPSFLRTLVERGKTFFADVQKSQWIYKTDPTSKRPQPGSRGKEKNLVTSPKAVTVADWVAAQPARKWKTIWLRNGSHGQQKVKILHSHVWVWDKEEEHAHCWHLVVKRRGKGDLQYTLSNAPGDIPTKAMAFYQGQRFKVEQSF